MIKIQQARKVQQDVKKQKLTYAREQTIFALVFTVPLVFISMVYMHTRYANYIMMILAFPVITVLGKQFFIGAWKQGIQGIMGIDLLIALSIGISFLFSFFNTFFPEYWFAKGIRPPVYFEATAVIITFVTIGKWLEERAKWETNDAIIKLMDLQVKKVWLISPNGDIVEMAPDQIKKGDILLVKAGERVPFDGIVCEGNTFIDESTLTGEPIPIEKTKGAQVYAGTINQNGLIHIYAKKVGRDTLLAQIIKRVQEAQDSKAPIQHHVDRLASICVPSILGLSLLTFSVWIYIGGDNGFAQAISSAVTVLIFACPCALGLATPTAIMGGMEKAAEHHILIKDAMSLENACTITDIVLDKTGTITTGEATVREIIWQSEDQHVKNILVQIERNSDHPLAKAIIKHLSTKTVFVDVHAIESVPGKGIKAKFQDEEYFIGNEEFIDPKLFYVPELIHNKAIEWREKAYTLVYFAQKFKVVALIAITDNIKTNAALAIANLKSQGIEVHMLTGDNKYAARAIANALEIEHVKSTTLPEDKSFYIKQLQSEGKVVAMVGDGVNDSVALAVADISIAMGKGSDIAMDVAQITLLSSDLSGICKSINISRLTVKTIKQNLFWAFIYNVAGLPIAAGVLIPYGIILDPVIASAAMALSSVSVVVNSLRIN